MWFRLEQIAHPRAGRAQRLPPGGGHEGANRQARAENGMYRCKRIIGDRLRSQHWEAQKREVLIAVNVINRMTALGMPESVKVVA